MEDTMKKTLDQIENQSRDLIANTIHPVNTIAPEEKKGETINTVEIVKPKHPGGRPKDYKGEETINKVREYIQNCIDEETEFHKTRGEKSDSYERVLKVKLPSIEGLAVFLNVARETIYDWKSKYEVFSDIIEELLALQANRLLDGGISGAYNSTIAKLILSKHGYHDKQEIEHSGVIETIERVSFSPVMARESQEDAN